MSKVVDSWYRTIEDRSTQHGFIYLSFRPFDLWPDFLSLDGFGWRTTGASSRKRSWHYRLGRFRDILVLEQVDAHAESSVGWQIPLSQLRHSPGELLHARLQVCEDGKIDLRLQAGCGTNSDAGTFALNAQVGFPQVWKVVVLVILRYWAQTSLPWFPLTQKDE